MNNIPVVKLGIIAAVTVSRSSSLRRDAQLSKQPTQENFTNVQ